MILPLIKPSGAEIIQGRPVALPYSVHDSQSNSSRQQTKMAGLHYQYTASLL